MDNAERVEQGLFCVYCLTNKLNGKKYIGQTFDIENRWKDKEESYKGCTALYEALCEHGWDNFEHEIIIDHLTADEADNMEKKLIAEMNTLVPNRYNINKGGGMLSKHYRIEMWFTTRISGWNYKHGLKVGQYDLNGNLVKTWDDVRDARLSGEDDDGWIKLCLQGSPKVLKRKRKRFFWKFSDENETLEQHIKLPF